MAFLIPRTMKTMKTLITIIRSVVALASVAGRNFLSVQFMKTNLSLLQTRIFCAAALGIGSFFGLAAATENSADTPPATTAIPWSQLGAKAGADYQGDALSSLPPPRALGCAAFSNGSKARPRAKGCG